jgi:hypothetical protein
MMPFCRLFALTGTALLLLLFGPAQAQQRSYWLTNASTLVASCPGKPDGEALRAANGNNAWVLITASVTCKDAGDGYVFSIDYMSVQVNPSNRSRVERDPMIFDWIALAIFQPKGSGETINWLYDHALPINGSLSKDSREKIYFGNLTFPKIAKADLDKAKNFTFYLTSQGVPFVFGLK